jgi:hypothetical protein
MKSPSDIICQHCGLVNDYKTEQQIFSDKTVHVKAICNGCNGYIKYIQTQPAKFYVGKYKDQLVSTCTDKGYMQWALKSGMAKGRTKAEVEKRIKEL